MKKHTAFFIYLLSFILLIANAYVYIHRNEYEYKKQSAYNDLYQPYSGKGINTFSVTEKKATLSFCGYKNETMWKIKIDTVVTGMQKSPLQFELKEDLHQYTFIPDDTALTPVTLTIDHSYRKRYAASGNSGNTNIEILYSSVPFIQETKKWIYTYDYIPAGEINISKAVLKNDAGVKDADADTVKFKKIALFIYKTLMPHSGVPSDSLLEMRPQQQLDCIRKRNAQVWCSSFSALLNYFCTISGLKIRHVGFTGFINSFSAGAHAANEIYIPEYGGWVYTDLTQNLIFIKDDAGNYLNTADLLFLKTKHIVPGLNAFRIYADSIVYEKISHPESLYGWNYSELLFHYEYNPSQLYSFKNKIKRYLTENSWFELYNTGLQYSNKNFYLKRFLFVSFVTSFVLSILAFALTKRTGND
ncbi:MAG: hypothetical protein K2X48_08005 [Chitinophagaceae bacterium]|nr:hypothetical protein [Chitinophagaceae bacterium]